MTVTSNPLMADTPTSPASTSTTTAAPSSTDTLSSENTFLKLLVAQIKNQDPTSPTDPTQFIGQLTQYSELEQLMQINSGLKNVETGSTATPAGGSNSTDPITNQP